MVKVTIEAAEQNLRQLVEQAAQGNEVLITDPSDTPIAKIVSAKATRRKRRAGTAKGEVWMADDFDAPLEDFREYTP